jgi:isoleucyl-tRNA synthetase
VVNPRAAGPRLGKDVQSVIRASKAGDWSADTRGVVTAGGVELRPGEYTLETVLTGGAGATAPLPGGGFILLDTAVTPELAAEGLARDVIRAVQQARRAADLDVSDRISLAIAGPPAALDAITAFRELVAAETLATALDLVGAGALDDDPQAGEPASVGDDSESVRIRVGPA